MVREALHDPSIDMEDIVAVHASSWHSDPDILGSYSAPTVGTRGNTDRKILALPEDAMFFCGEHTHFSGRFQSMDGAFETGTRAAQEALKYLRHHSLKTSPE